MVKEGALQKILASQNSLEFKNIVHWVPFSSQLTTNLGSNWIKCCLWLDNISPLTLHKPFPQNSIVASGEADKFKRALLLSNTFLAPMKIVRRRKKSRWALPRGRCWKHWKCQSSMWHSSSSAGPPTPSLAHGEGRMSDRKSNIHSRDTIDSVFGYSYSKKVLQHQSHHQFISNLVQHLQMLLST